MPASVLISTLVLCLILAVAACSSPPPVQPMATVEVVASKVELEAPDPTAVPTAALEASDPTATQVVESESATRTIADEPAIEVEASGAVTDQYGAAVASIAERVYLADVIVRSQLVSANDGILNFRAIEYLKGSGDPTFSVNADTEGRSTLWDNVEAMLFLELTETASDGGSGATTNLEFADTTVFDYWGEDSWPQSAYSRASSYGGARSAGYTVLSNNPVWLPAETQAGASGDSDNVTYIDAGLGVEPRGAGGATQHTVKLSEIRAVVAWVTGGEGIDGYGLCVSSALDSTRYYRDSEAFYGPLEPYYSEVELQSGSPAGTVIFNEIEDEYQAQYSEHGYNNYVLDGPDAALFMSEVADEDGMPLNGYETRIVTKRPLPAGEYTFYSRWQAGFWVPCDYVPYTNRETWTVTVTAVEGITHELWLETAWDDGANAADGTVGTLTPSAFGAGTIDRIAYVPGTGKVSITVTPATLLDGHTLDFMRNDGSVALILHEEDATRNGSTLTWSRPKPWSNGDELFVTIRPTMQAPSNVQAAYADGEITVSWGGAENATGIILFLDSVGGNVDGSQRADIDATATSHTFTIEHSGHYAVTVVAQQMYRNAAYDKHVALEPMEVTIE